MIQPTSAPLVPAPGAPIAAPVAAPVEPPVAVVSADEGTALAQLQAQYAEAKALAAEAKSRLDSIVAGIKAELTANPTSTKINLTGSDDGSRVPLRLTWVEKWTVDTKRLKAEQPYIYAAYAQRSGSWQLSAVR